MKLINSCKQFSKKIMLITGRVEVLIIIIVVSSFLFPRMWEWILQQEIEMLNWILENLYGFPVGE